MESEKVLSLDIPLFIKWAGGKTQLLKQLSDSLPNDFNDYYEPFLGGGAMAFFILKNFKPKKAVLSDTNEELINTYKAIRDNVEGLIKELKTLKQNHSEEFYYNIRNIDTSKLSNIQRAARFIYLNKTCFNGLYRVNSKGKFNVPIGSYTNPGIFSEETLKEASELLQDVVIETNDFSCVLNKAGKEDLVYFDPPYYPIKKESFTTYTKNEFLDEKHKELAQVFNNLSTKGCFCMQSNSYTDFTKKLYQNFNQKTVNAKRMINCNGKERGEIKELIITNY
jgi:DNA adenine methylase